MHKEYSIIARYKEMHISFTKTREYLQNDDELIKISNINYFLISKFLTIFPFLRHLVSKFQTIDLCISLIIFNYLKILKRISFIMNFDLIAF